MRNLILDDELYQVFSGFTQKGAKVDLISDSCHSGTISKGATTAGVQKRTEPLATVFGVRRFSDLKFDQPSKVKSAAILPPVKGLYISLSGSQDDEFSLDASANGIPMGLFTSTLLRSINGLGGTKLTYAKLMLKVEPDVAKAAKALDNNQNPQIGSEFGNPNAIIFSVPTGK